MSDDPRRTQPFCTPRCYRECQCSRWLDYLDRWGNPVNHGQDETTPPLPCYYLTFDGLNDWITLAGLTVTSPFTISMWVKKAALSTRDWLIGSAGGGCPLFIYDQVDRVYFQPEGGTIQSTGAIASTNWGHIGVVCPLGLAPLIYLDGVDQTAGGAGVGGGPYTFNLIGASNLPTDWLGGLVGAFGIAPVALNVPAMWAAGDFHRPLSPAVFTAACWNLRQEGGLGTTLIDEAVGNDGTFLGAGEPAWGGLMSVGGPAGWTD